MVIASIQYKALYTHTTDTCNLLTAKKHGPLTGSEVYSGHGHEVEVLDSTYCTGNAVRCCGEPIICKMIVDKPEWVNHGGDGSC